MVHLEVFASQEGRDPPIAIGRPLPCEALDGSLQGRFIAGVRLIVVAAARRSQHPTDLAHRILAAEHLDYLPLGLDRWRKMLVAFFRMSFSSVNRPTSRSSSATWVASWSLRYSGRSNAAGACLKNTVFHSPKTEAAIWGSW